MRSLAILVCLPLLAPGQYGNFTEQYVGDVHVFLSCFSAGVPDAGPGEWDCGNFSVDGDRIHRIFRGQRDRPVFAYDLRVTPDLSAGTIEVEVVRPQGNVRTFEKLPPRTKLTNGDRVNIPVWENRQTGDRIFDSYALGIRGTAMNVAPKLVWHAKDAPAGTLLSIDCPSLSTASASVGENSQFGATGPVVWVYGKWAGRFLFSATARPGYRRLGAAADARIDFTEGSEQYTLRVRRPVLAEPGSWWIWVKHEADYRLPAGNISDQELRHGVLAVGAER